MTTVSVYSYTHSTTYVADNIHKSLKDIVRLSGLDPSSLMEGRESAVHAMRTWIESGHLERVTLEIYDPKSDQLVLRWDLDIVYEWSGSDGNFYTDTDQLRYHILKAGVVPSEAKYRLILHNRNGRPDVEGWSPTTYRSTDGMVKQSLGSTIQHNGLGANAGYWRKTSC